MAEIPTYDPSTTTTTEPIPPVAADPNPPPADPDTADVKAKKADFGVGGKVKETYPDFYKSFIAGQESQLRDSVAQQIAVRNAQLRSDIISKVSNTIAGPLTPEDYDMIDRRIAEPEMPASVFEDHFARRYMDHIAWQARDADSDGWMKATAEAWPKELEAYKQIGVNIIAANQLIEGRLQQLAPVIQDQSTLRRAWDIGKSFIPGYSNYEFGSFFPGHMLQNESINYHNMPRQEQIDYLSKVHDRYKDNPQIEAEYLTALKGIGTQERFARDMMLPVDAATMFTGGKGIRNALFPSKEVGDVVAGMVSSVDEAAATIAAPAAAGDIKTAGIRRATDDVMSTLAGNDPRVRLVQGLWDYFTGKVNDLRADPSGFAKELSNQLQERYAVVADTIETKLTTMMRNERIPFMRAFESIMEEANNYIKANFPSVDNKILDISRPFKDMSNAWNYTVRLGNQYLQYFENANAADFYARIHKIKDYSIESANVAPELVHSTALEDARMEMTLRYPRLSPDEITAKAKEEVERRIFAGDLEKPAGTGYYISINRPWNETDVFTRNQVTKAIETEPFKTPDSYVNYLMGSIRSPEETMSLFARTQRGIATFGPNVLNKIAISLGKDVQELGKGTYPWSAQRGKWNDFKRILRLGDSLYDLNTQKPGYTFRNPGELESAYRSLLGRAPDEQEIRAYFAWKQLREFDWLLRNLTVYKNKARTGSMDIRLNPRGPDGNPVTSEWFTARPVNGVPSDDGSHVLVTGRSVGDEQLVKTSALRKGTAVGDRLRSGNPADKLQIYEIYDRFERPLEGFGKVDGRDVRYVVGNNIDTRNLQFKQLPETGGGHFIYDYPFFLKQAIINKDVTRAADPDKGLAEIARWTYEGDKTLWAIRTRAEGRIIEKRLNAIREFIRDGKYDEAKDYLRDNPVGYNYKDIYEMFKPLPKRNARTGRMMKAQPAVDLHEPIRLMDNHVNIGDAFESEYKTRWGRNYINSQKSGNPASMYNVAFTGERDVRQLMTIMDEGGRGNPVWNVQPAEMVDPITSLNRGLSGIMNSFFFDDLKIGFMEHWVQEAKPYLQLRKNDIQNQLMALFHNPPWIKAANKDQEERIRQLEIARQQHLQLVSRPGEQESRLMSMAQHLADAMYNKLGPKFVINPMSFYAATRDAPAFLRGMAFHFKLGMFNPSQFIKQLNTWATISGIEGPGRASQGAVAALLHNYSRINSNPEILDGLSKIAEKFGWRPGELVEAMNFMKETGFDTVAGEYASRDKIWSGDIVTNGRQRFLGLGDSFFTEGERNVRYGAFYTAYRRFRDAHPTGALSDADKEEILQRARLLNVNMDRAANSIWQHGLSSIPFQFQTYALRTAELMFGKRLSSIEKARLIGTYSLLYGLPVAGTLSGFPIADWLRKKAIDNNYNVGESYITDTLMNGIPATLMEMITGKTYNIGEELGGQGLSSLNNMLGSDPSWYKILLAGVGGPSGGILADSIENSSPLLHWFANIYTDGYNTDWQDVVQLFKAISSVRMADQDRMALETGNWYSRKGALLDTDIEPMDVIINILSGMTHQHVSDAYLKAGLETDRKEYNKVTEQEFTDRIHKALMNAQTGAGYNPDQASKYFQDAGNLLKMRNYPIEDYHQLYGNAMKGWESFIDRIDKSFMTTHIPAGREVDQLQRYIKLQQLKNQGHN